MLECTRTDKVMMWNYYKIITYYYALQRHNEFRNNVSGNENVLKSYALCYYFPCLMYLFSTFKGFRELSTKRN